MSNVYLKNRTSSAITVAGYTVHYMDKTDAEIVEVEGVEDITRSDDASGTISAITLPTANSYTGVSFDSLRYYASGRIATTGTAFNLWQSSSTWYYGTITWTDESLGDLSDKIIVNSTSSSSMKTQTVFRIIFIYDSNISGYHPMDTAESSQGQITDYSYNNGVHSITFYLVGTNWTSGTFSGRIQFRYLDGVTTFNNLNAFDLVSASGGSLSKNTTSIRYDMYNVWNNSITIHAQYSVQNQVKYNAFKYLLSSVPYWYVIDGIQTDWIDNLTSIGYSEIQLLPIVTKRNDLYIEPDNYNHQIGSGSEAFLYEYVNGSYRGLLYDDTTKKQCVYGWMYLNSGTWERYYYGLSAVLKSGTSNSLGVRNDTSSTIDVTRILYAECSDPLAIIITVYNSQNAYFNAFKYTVDSVDYYYVLDGTQNDWTNDLSSIGYEIKDFEEITLYMASGLKHAQPDISSGFSGNVDPTYTYPLYYNSGLTDPFAYDYSKDYEVGYYRSSTGEWVRYTVQSVSDMSPSSGMMGRILLDTGALWLITNMADSTMTSTSITVRIYPKEQQWIPVFPYNPSKGEYDNLSINRKGTFVRKGSPACVFGTFPAIAESFGYKSGMIKTASIQAELQISQAVLYLNVVGNPALSNIIIRFENDICTGYVRSDKADLPTSPSYDGATYTLKDDNGTDIDYDDSFTYKFVLLLNSTGDTVGGTYSTGAMIKSSTGKLQVRLRSMSSKFNRVWYYRIPIS